MRIANNKLAIQIHKSIGRKGSSKISPPERELFAFPPQDIQQTTPSSTSASRLQCVCGEIKNLNLTWGGEE